MRDDTGVERLTTVFDHLCVRLREECLGVYGGNLTSLVVFGSVGRGTPTYDSDIDLLLIAKYLPQGRLARVHTFDEVERRMSKDIEEAAKVGVNTRLSPLFRAESEMRLGGLIFLDMTEDSKILYDRDGFFDGYLNRLRTRLREMKSVRVRRGSSWYWVLKPDLKPGEVFDL